MKINYPNFVKLIEQFYAVLVYGHDYGLIAETCDQIIKQLIPGEQSIFNFSVLQYNNLIKNPELLYNEFRSLSLTKEKKIVYITEVDKVMPVWLKELLIQPVQDVVLIFRSLELPSGSSIRKFFEIEKRLAIIACYHDVYATTENIIKSKLKQSNITIEKTALKYLVAGINVDRLITVSELDKLIIFAGNNGQISLSDVQNVTCQFGNFSIEDLCYDVAVGDVTDFDLRLRWLLSNKINIVSIIRAVMRLFQQLLKAKLLIDKGVEVDQAIQRLTPAIFFKYVPVFTKCLKHFSIERLQDVIVEFTRLEILCKTTNTEHACLFEYVVLNQIMPKMTKN